MNNKGKELSLYVHVPFCVKKCLYCDFLSFSAGRELIDAYFESLLQEIKKSAEDYQVFEVKSIFFGGGTPSYVDSGHICRALECIRSCYHVEKDAEISIEVNPASAISSKLSDYREAGINRISIGAQSLNDEELKAIGRAHDVSMFLETFENARKAGFDNINVDVMSALPDQSLESYVKTLLQVVKLKPEHISAYSLIIEEGTPFYDMDLRLPSEDVDRQMYHETKRILAENGYHRYEISNYARSEGADGLGGENGKPDHEKYECVHNKVYWRRGNYLGLGLGASSMVENVRWKNTIDVKKYIKLMGGDRSSAIENGQIGELQELREEVQKLSEKECMEEFMFLGLRLVSGVDTHAFEEIFGHGIREVYGEVIDKYISMGLLEMAGKYLKLTDEGLDVSNTIMSEFLLDE